MAVDDVPLDDKVKRTRDLLSSFYSPDPSMVPNASSKYPTLDAINTASFDPDQYMNLLVKKSNLGVLLQRHVEMAAEIKNLDTDLQMLVYENYNKFISATDTIKRMKSNIVGMESNMEQLLEKIMSVQSRSDGVNTSLFEKRQHVEKLHCTRNLLRKVQFIYDLPTTLEKCIKSESYADAVRFYIGAMPIFKAYGDSSFLDCKRASEEAIEMIIKNLQEKLFSDSESIHVRAEAAVLLKQLDFPVESLKGKLLEKLEQLFTNLQLESKEISNAADSDSLSKLKNSSKSESTSVHGSFIREFTDAVHAYREIFPDSDKELIRLSHDLVTKHFEFVEQHIKTRTSSAYLLGMLGAIWMDVLLIDEVLPEAAVPDFTLEAVHIAVKQYITSVFTNLLLEISGAITKIKTKQTEGGQEKLQVTLEASKKAVIQGSMAVLLDFRGLLEDNSELFVKLRKLIVDWVQEGFQDFFSALEEHFMLLSGQSNSASQVQGSTGLTQGDKVLAGIVLVLAQLSVFIEQTAIPRITEEIAASFSGGSIRGYEHGPAFVPGEICRTFRSASEKFLHLYIKMKTQKISVLLRKRFTTPNWIKHREPREVHMFVNLFLQEIEIIETEVKQILPQRVVRHHHRTDSNGSSASSRSNPLRDDNIGRSNNTQRARSQLLETHLAKLFKQKLEIFTKVEYTQESVVNTVVKLCLKSLQEFVRLQTFNRSGFQQIQLDVQFLRTAVKETAEDEAVDFLLDEVIVAAAERCLDPVPLEVPILDKLIQAKLAKTGE